MRLLCIFFAIAVCSNSLTTAAPAPRSTHDDELHALLRELLLIDEKRDSENVISNTNDKPGNEGDEQEQSMTQPISSDSSGLPVAASSLPAPKKLLLQAICRKRLRNPNRITDIADVKNKQDLNDFLSYRLCQPSVTSEDIDAVSEIIAGFSGPISWPVEGQTLGNSPELKRDSENVISNTNDKPGNEGDQQEQSMTRPISSDSPGLPVAASSLPAPKKLLLQALCRKRLRNPNQITDIADVKNKQDLNDFLSYRLCQPSVTSEDIDALSEIIDGLSGPISWPVEGQTLGNSPELKRDSENVISNTNDKPENEGDEQEQSMTQPISSDLPGLPVAASSLPAPKKLLLQVLCRKRLRNPNQITDIADVKNKQDLNDFLSYRLCQPSVTSEDIDAVSEIIAGLSGPISKPVVGLPNPFVPETQTLVIDIDRLEGVAVTASDQGTSDTNGGGTITVANDMDEGTLEETDNANGILRSFLLKVDETLSNLLENYEEEEEEEPLATSPPAPRKLILSALCGKRLRNPNQITDINDITNRQELLDYLIYRLCQPSVNSEDIQAISEIVDRLSGSSGGPVIGLPNPVPEMDEEELEEADDISFRLKDDDTDWLLHHMDEEEEEEEEKKGYDRREEQAAGAEESPIFTDEPSLLTTSSFESDQSLLQLLCGESLDQVKSITDIQSRQDVIEYLVYRLCQPTVTSEDVAAVATVIENLSSLVGGDVQPTQEVSLLAPEDDSDSTSNDNDDIQQIESTVSPFDYLAQLKDDILQSLQKIRKELTRIRIKQKNQAMKQSESNDDVVTEQRFDVDMDAKDTMILELMDMLLD